MKSLFQTSTPPQQMPPGTPGPQPGPNAVEVAVAQYDPDQGLVVLSLPGDVQAAIELDGLPQEGQGVELLLTDTRLGPRIKLVVLPAREMPKFNSIEEADAWLDANT